jgi:hypothetical protein
LQEVRKAQAANHAHLDEQHRPSLLYVLAAAAYQCLSSCLQEVRKAQAANRARLDEEYRRLVGNLVQAQQLQGGEEWLANPALPEDIVRESMPGMRTVCYYYMLDNAAPTYCWHVCPDVPTEC